MSDNRSDLVYSTGQGRICPDCGAPKEACRCAAAKASRILGDGKVRVSRETQGRKGNGVTLVTGLPLDETGLLEIARTLKTRCCAGGTVKNGAIEIQGDHRAVILEMLQKLGWMKG